MTRDTSPAETDSAAQISPVIMALSPVLLLGPALTCGIPRIMAPLFIVCALVAMGADLYQRRSLKPRFDKELALLFGSLVIYGALGLGWSVNPHDTLSKIEQFLMIFVPLVALAPAITRLNPSSLRAAGLLIMGGLCLGIAMYLSEAFNNFPFYDGLRGGHSNDVVDVKQNKPAVLCALWLYMAFPFFVPRSSIPRRALYAATAALVFYITKIGESASAQWIIMGVPALVVFLLAVPARLALRAALIATITLSAAMPVLVLAISRHSNWQENRLLNDSVKSRIEIWDQAARRTEEKPLLGWGLDSSSVLPNRGDLSYMSALTHKPVPIHHLHPHNGPIQVWFELGAVGAALLCALHALFFRRLDMLGSALAQKFGAFMWGCVFLYTLSIWGVWQTWFLATLCFTGLMTAAGVRHLEK